MSRRKLEQNGNFAIYFDRETEEFIVKRISTRSDAAAYFASDIDDARSTMRAFIDSDKRNIDNGRGEEASATTLKIIESFKGLPGEWEMLKGLLCADHAMEYGSDEQKRWAALINASMVAARMDAINKAERAKLVAEIEAEQSHRAAIKSECERPVPAGC